MHDCPPEFVMAARAYWKGYLRLSLVSCPIQFFHAASEREKNSFLGGVLRNAGGFLS